MLTFEEEDRIVQKAVETMLRILPETIGNLMKTNALYAKLNKSFYEQNPEFVKHKDIVAQTISRVEGENPLLQYDDILSKALPLIKKNIQEVKKLDNTIPVKANLNTTFKLLDNGEI